MILGESPNKSAFVDIKSFNISFLPAIDISFKFSTWYKYLNCDAAIIPVPFNRFMTSPILFLRSLKSLYETFSATSFISVASNSKFSFSGFFNANNSFT